MENISLITGASFAPSRLLRQGVIFAMAGMFVLISACNNDDDANGTNNQQTQTLSVTDREFMEYAGHANRAEIELGELALSKGTHDSILVFAQRMVNEHTLAQNELLALGVQENVSVPDTLDALHKQLQQQLMMLEGAEFDSAYIASQVADHQLTQQRFQEEIDMGQDADVKNYAAKYLPHITMHLQQAVIIKETIEDEPQ